MFLHNQLLASPPLIDGKRVEVGYHKQSGPSHSGTVNTSQNQAAANSALAAAQWTNKSNSGNGTSAAKQYTDTEIERNCRNTTQCQTYINRTLSSGDSPVVMVMRNKLEVSIETEQRRGELSLGWTILDLLRTSLKTSS